jgi:hypothetical protein
VHPLQQPNAPTEKRNPKAQCDHRSEDEIPWRYIPRRIRNNSSKRETGEQDREEKQPIKGMQDSLRST